ncbi:hypothetical protein LMF89_23540 [Pelosinus sp. Bkl1]|uniref:Methyltransferase small domain-containing protein n=2 Tax=Pelosinus baikalensis TaxID=2892015 RepID=A0ABS8I0I0_9FIRM|nr:hypothetical protein [Pelosinus baikalensis]
MISKKPDFNLLKSGFLIVENEMLIWWKQFRDLKVTMMGPNAMRVAEELASCLNVNENMRILDLGCGCGLSTLLLTPKYGAKVFAADLWISPTEN